ncbi:MAG: hypothetical protein M1830_010558 [Pleopsidium flavum]|nr:MAG: hypothetical protein M1830_010558 [Pleopsidium flavum]
MTDYTEPDLEVVLELELRYAINRNTFVDIFLRNHAPPLQLTVIHGQSVSAIDPNTSRTYDLDDIILSSVANHLAEIKVPALGDIKLSSGTEFISDRFWTLRTIASPEQMNFRRVYGGHEEYPVENGDVIRVCLQIRTPRLAYSNLKTWQTTVNGVLEGLQGPKPFGCWTNDSCGFAVQIDLVDSPLSFDALLNLITLWGVYEKDIEKFHPRQRRHPHNAFAISLRFGDGGSGDAHGDIRANTQDGRAAFVAKVYAVQSLFELNALINSSLAKGNRKVHITDQATRGSSDWTVTFAELGGIMAWGVLSVWCTFVCSVVRYAHLMANQDVTFDVHGETDIEDLLEMIELPAGYRQAFLAIVEMVDTADKLERLGPAVQNYQSSQGGPHERPPNYWIRSELETFNALGVPSGSSTHGGNQVIHHVAAPDLTGNIHRIFNLEYWDNNLGRKNWNFLRQAFILATRLLVLGEPWFGSFLPRAKCGVTNGPNSQYATVQIPFERDPTPAAMEHVQEDLLAMAGNIRWGYHDDLLPKKDCWAETHLGNFDRASGLPLNQTVAQHVKQDQYEQDNKKQTRRKVCITIAGHLISAVIRAEPGTERQLFAVFFLATTLVSELGHAVWLINFENRPYANVRVGNDVHINLGNSLLGSIFGGWYPKPSYLEKKVEDYYFVRDGLHWNKLFQRPMQRPLYTTAYSLPVHHIQSALTQERWDLMYIAAFPLEAWRRMLKPQTPFQQRHTARTSQRVATDDPLADWGDDKRAAKDYEDADWEVTPPPKWDREDLIAAGALGCSVSLPSLTENINPIFAFKHWTRAPEDLGNAQGSETSSLTKDEYGKLEPAMRLATLLLKVGASWFTSLLPNIKWYRESAYSDSKAISAVQSPSPDDLAAAKMALGNLAGHVRFDHNPRQLPEDDHLSLSSRGKRSKPDKNGDYKYVSMGSKKHNKLDAVEKAKNRPCRRIQISLSSQVINAILDSAPDTERYLQAVYSLATTLTHELGHAVLYTNFEWPLSAADPPVQGEADIELGRSLIARIHGGWDVCNNPELDKEGRATFSYGCSWRKWYKTLSTEEWLPRYWTYYSIPVHFIQRQFLQATWDAFDLDSKPEEAADVLLRPLTPFRKGEHARMAEKTGHAFWVYSEAVAEQWYAGYGPDEEDDRVDPRYEDPDWDNDPMAAD